MPLSEDDIKGQGRFPRTAQPGDHDELVPRDVHLDVFQIVVAGTTDGDGMIVRGHGQRRSLGVGELIDIGRRLGQIVAQELAGVRRRTLAHLLRCPTGDHSTTGLTPFWAKINEVIGTFNDFHIVLDHEQRVPLL